MKRKSDRDNRAHYRSDRMVQEGGSWYFNTREGDLVGPFKDEVEAAEKLGVYIRLAKLGLLPERDAMSLAPQAKAKAS